MVSQLAFPMGPGLPGRSQQWRGAAHTKTSSPAAQACRLVFFFRAVAARMQLRGAEGRWFGISGCLPGIPPRDCALVLLGFLKPSALLFL